MHLPLVDLDSWIALEDQLARHYGKSRWRQQRILKALLRFAWWRVPTVADAWEETGGRSRPALARRCRHAGAELEMMATLPPLTRDPVLEHKVKFGVLPTSAIVRPDDRRLSYCHVWALTDRRAAADLICKTIGGRWLVPLDVLEDELQRRTDELVVDRVKAAQDQARESRRGVQSSGPQVVGITF